MRCETFTLSPAEELVGCVVTGTGTGHSRASEHTAWIDENPHRWLVWDELTGESRVEEGPMCGKKSGPVDSVHTDTCIGRQDHDGP
ncbi:hypothetical protein [Streptomyces termitum]|uniref:hypothetical protein n=1 Tax=Streptomyces termitum TaxID=67368 RepID=UPI0033A13BEA